MMIHLISLFFSFCQFSGFDITAWTKKKKIPWFCSLVGRQLLHTIHRLVTLSIFLSDINQKIKFIQHVFDVDIFVYFFRGAAEKKTLLFKNAVILEIILCFKEKAYHWRKRQLLQKISFKLWFCRKLFLTAILCRLENYRYSAN